MTAHRAALLAAAVLAAPVGAAGLPRVFIETHVSPSDPYVQAAARMTVSVYSARALYHAELNLQGNADVVVRQVGLDGRTSARRDGRLYEVLTRQYLIFGERSGRLKVPGVELTGEVLTPLGRANPYYNPGGRSLSPYGYGGMVSVAPFVLHGEPAVLDVRARPAGTPARYWLPATAVTLARQWSQGSLTTRVGDALAVDFTVQAQGLTAAQLPDVTALLEMPPGLRAYPDDPKLDDYAQGDTLVGRREQSVALIADRPGRFTIPAMALRWWDTAHDVERTASLPPQTIRVLPSVGSAHGAGAAGRRGAGAVPGTPWRTHPWAWASLALAVAWMATLAAWYLRERGRPRSPRVSGPVPAAPGASRSRAAFLQGCRADDPRAARRHLLEWARAAWPADAPRGLNELARRIGDARTERLLRELDRACFAGAAWRGAALAAQLSDLPAVKRSGRDRPPIEPLYH